MRTSGSVPWPVQKLGQLEVLGGDHGPPMDQGQNQHAIQGLVVPGTPRRVDWMESESENEAVISRKYEAGSLRLRSQAKSSSFEKQNRNSLCAPCALKVRTSHSLCRHSWLGNSSRTLPLPSTISTSTCACERLHRTRKSKKETGRVPLPTQSNVAPKRSSYPAPKACSCLDDR